MLVSLCVVCADFLGHMAIVTNGRVALGVITLEDVIEGLIGEEIVDETDVFVNGKMKKKRESSVCL